MPSNVAALRLPWYRTLSREVAMGGYGKAATIVGLFFIVGLIAAPFLPETRGKPLPHALWRDPAAASEGRGST